MHPLPNETPEKRARHLESLAAAAWSVRQKAFDELLSDGVQSIPTLIENAAAASARVRAACIALMDHLGDDRCCETLAHALRDPSALVRRHAVHTVGCQACKAHALPIDVVGALIDRTLGDPSIRVRRVAVHQLGLQPHDPRIIEALTHVLASSTDKGIRTRAQHALQIHKAHPADHDPHAGLPHVRANTDARPPEHHAPHANLRSIRVVCGSSPYVDDLDVSSACEVARLHDLTGRRIVYGGRRLGLMGAFLPRRWLASAES